MSLTAFAKTAAGSLPFVDGEASFPMRKTSSMPTWSASASKAATISSTSACTIPYTPGFKGSHSRQ